MSTEIIVAVYFPIFFILFIVLRNNRKNKDIASKSKNLRREKIMSNELIKECIGKICTISTGGFEASYSKVEIIEVVDNWVKVERKGKVHIINSDYIQNIKIHN